MGVTIITSSNVRAILLFTECHVNRFDPPIHGISNPLLWYYEPLSFGRNEGGQFTMRVQNTMTKN